MGSFPSAALQIKQQPSFLQQAGEAMQLSNLAGQRQLQNIEIQNAQADQAAFQAANQQWKPGEDGKFDQNDYLELFRKNGGSSPTYFKLQSTMLQQAKDHSQILENNAKAAVDLATVKTQNMQKVAGDIDNIQSLPPEKQGAALSQMLQDRVADKTFTVQEAQQYAGIQPEHLDDIKKHVLGEKAYYDDLQAKAKAKQDATNAELTQMKLEREKGISLPELQAQVDSIFDPNNPAELATNKRYKAQLANIMSRAGGYEQATKLLDEASKQKGTIETQTNPEIQQGKVDVAKAEGAARAAVETAAARGSNVALANVPKNLIQPATAAAEKAGNEYNDALAAARDMKTFISDARSGNKIAYAYAPTEGVLTLNTSRGVKRVNMPEIHSYTGAGSLADRVEAWFGKNLSGASIPPDILDDMEKLHMGIASNAKKTYAGKLKNTNTIYGSAFKPVEPEEPEEPPSNAKDPLGIR